MKKLKVFTDFHHASLLQSLILLFEKRFDGEVYRPIGTEWHSEGYWKIYDHPATVEQYLGIGGATPDGTPKLNEVVGGSTGGHYLCQDIDSGQTNKAITLEAFFDMEIDIVIASIPQHIEPFKKLCEAHVWKPKLIFQIGNAWTTGAGLAPNIMASAIINNVPDNINFISYHQEFDLDIFKPQPDMPVKNRVGSFINCFNTEPHFEKDWKLFTEVERLLPDWKFRAFGGQCRDGAAHGHQNVANAINNSKFVWHTKFGGDGYGHIIHNAAACGKPLIVNKSYYKGKMAEPLITDETSIIIDGLTPIQIRDRILAVDDQKYKDMCHAMYDTFKRVVNFDVEEIYMRKFIENLV